MRKVFSNPVLHETVKTFLLGSAWAEFLRAEVDSVYAEVLKVHAIYNDLEVEHGMEKVRITENKDTYLTHDMDTMQKIYNEVDKRLRTAGLKPDEMPLTHCPALCAESDLVDIKHELIRLSGNPFGVTVDKLLSNGFAKYNEWIRLTVGGVMAMPNFTPPSLESIGGKS